MSEITTRSGKGLPLTHDEVDANFTNLNTDKYESGDVAQFNKVTVKNESTLSAGSAEVIFEYQAESLGSVYGASGAAGGTGINNGYNSSGVFAFNNGAVSVFTPTSSRVVPDLQVNSSGNVSVKNDLTITSGDLTVTAGDLTVDTDTLHADSANNRVGVNTALPKYSLDIEGAVYSGVAAYSGVDYGDTPGYVYLNGSFGGAIVASYGSSHRFTLTGGSFDNSLVTYNNTGFFLRANQTQIALGTAGFGGTGAGVVEFKTGALLDTTVTFDTNSNVTINAGNGDGYGITFNSTTHNAATTLDYYEEGFVNLEIADAATGGNVASTSGSSCYYTRIGRMVYVSINIVNIDTTGLNSANFLHIRNLPYTVLSGTGTTYAAAGAVQNINSSGTNERQSFGLAFTESTNYARLAASGEYTTIDLISISDIFSGTNAIRANVFYFAQ